MMELTADEMRKRTMIDPEPYIKLIQEKMMNCEKGESSVWMGGIPRIIEHKLQKHFENRGFSVYWNNELNYRKIIVSWEKPIRKKWWQK